MRGHGGYGSYGHHWGGGYGGYRPLYRTGGFYGHDTPRRYTRFWPGRHYPAVESCDCEAPVRHTPPPVVEPCAGEAPAPVVKKVYVPVRVPVRVEVPVPYRVEVKVPVRVPVYVPVKAAEPCDCEAPAAVAPAAPPDLRPGAGRGGRALRLRRDCAEEV